MQINANALLLIAVCVVVGFLLHHWLLGLLVGLVVVLIASLV